MNEKFWDIMFEALENTTDEEWKAFVKEFDERNEVPIYEFNVTITNYQTGAMDASGLLRVIETDGYDANVVTERISNDINNEYLTLAA